MKTTRTASVAKLVVVIDDDPLVLEALGGYCAPGATASSLVNPATRP
jgi:hypothetical protein